MNNKLVRSQTLITLTGLPVSLYFWLKYYFVEIPFRRPPQVHSGSFQSTGLWCICALYQPKKTSANLATYFSCLRDAGYNIIAVHNGPCAPDLIESLLPYCHSILIRSPGGRDFGSYKFGTAYLAALQQASDNRQTLYCNDSVFIRPSALQFFLADFSTRKDDYIGVVESIPFHYHIGSWFFAVSGRVFNASYFQTFWKKYLPTSERSRGVAKGEVGLTRVLIRNGIYLQVLYSAKNNLDRLFGLGSGLPKALTLFLDHYTYHEMELEGDIDTLLPPNTIRADNRIDILKNIFIQQSSLKGGIDFFQLFLLRYFNFPFIKKDIVFRNNCSCFQLQRATEQWQGADTQQLYEIMGAFRLRGSIRWYRFVRKLCVAWGLCS